jgi:hypothetical protein
MFDCNRLSSAAILFAFVIAWRATNAGAQTNTEPADVLIVNAKVYTADGGAFRQAVAIRGNKIVRVGDTQEILSLRGPKTDVIDANGSAVVPGFSDIHTHLLQGGLQLANVSLDGARTLADIQNRIQEFAKAHPERAWIQGMGWQYEAFPGNLPTREQLDALVPDRPVVLTCFDGHSVWVNSKALALAGINEKTPDPPNGFIVRDPKTGEPTGLLKETPAMALVQKLVPQPTRKEQMSALRAASAEAHRFGVTSVTDAAGNPEDLEAYEEARRTGDLSVRVNYSLLVTPGFTEKDADHFDAVWHNHPDSAPSSAMLKTGVIKIFMDGVIETNTAFMLANYANTPSRGKPNYSVDDYNRVIQMMDRRGWQIMVHAIGDGAVRMTLDGFERLSKVNPMPARGRRSRVEHIETIDLADVPRFGQLGVIASMHPGGGFFPPNRAATTPGFLLGVWGRNLGPERAARGFQWKSISDAGGRVIFGSDWPVASLDAMGRIYSITHRGAFPGGTDQRLPLTTAFDDYTRECAYATFDEKQKGVLAPGMLADIVVLATDVFSHQPATRADIGVKVTIFDGKVVYRAK